MVPVQWRWSEAFWSCSDRFGVFWGRNDGQFNNRLSRSLRKHPTFCHATTCFQGKRRLRNEHRSSMLMTCHYLDLGRASDCLKQIFLTSSVWNLCSRSSDLISRGNQWWGRGMTAAFSGYLSWVCKLNNLSVPHLRAVYLNMACSCFVHKSCLLFLVNCKFSANYKTCWEDISKFPGPLYQNEVKCSAFDVGMIFHSHMQVKHIFTRKAVHLASFWK